MLDIKKIEKDFPIFQEKIYNKPLVYLDNAATTQKPQEVIEKVVEFYSKSYSNIHRGVHHLSEQASNSYEEGRTIVKEFINADNASEIVFTRNTTESINLIATSFGKAFLKEGDEIIISEMEHHSNIIPWQILSEELSLKLKILPFNNEGQLVIEELGNLISSKTKLIAVTYLSNVLGILNKVEDIIKIAHNQNIPVLLDGAQAIQHIPIDVQKLDCDFFVFSGHKLYAETGIGVLYGKEKWLDAIPPYQTGGGMVGKVTLEKTTYAPLPLKFEAGTNNFVGAVSLGTAIQYLNNIGLKNICTHEEELLAYAEERLNAIKGITIYGKTEKRHGLISFNLDNIHPYDAGMILDKMGIAIRTGTHCAEPIMAHYGINGTIRASFALYNKKEDVDKLIEGIEKTQTMLS